ncbi:unnamed protein product [Lota lota]
MIKGGFGEFVNPVYMCFVVGLDGFMTVVPGIFFGRGVTRGTGGPASVKDTPWAAPVPGLANWEETLGKTEDGGKGG